MHIGHLPSISVLVSTLGGTLPSSSLPVTAINKTKAHTLITGYVTYQAITKTVDDKSCDVVKNFAKENCQMNTGLYSLSHMI